MPAAPPARLRLSARSMVLAVALFGLTATALRLIAASGRVIGWIMVAAILAGLLHPLVASLSRRIPRGLALPVVLLGTIGTVALVGYAVVDDVTAEVRELQRAVPDAAADLERSERFGEAAREFELANRAESFVDELPERLRGGEVQDALRSAATRGVAFLATFVLTVFFLLHGGQLLSAAARQLHDDPLEERVRRVGLAVYRRATRYVGGSLTMAAAAGLIAYGIGTAADLPGRAPLALWVAVFDLVPLLGVVLGAAPMVLLATTTASPIGAIGVAAVLLAWQLVEALVFQPRVEAQSLHIGPFVTVAVGMVGLELYGIGGALVGLVAAVVVAAALDEWMTEREAARRYGPESPAQTAAPVSSIR